MLILRQYVVYITVTLVGFTAMSLLASCYESDLGNTCGTAATPAPTDPIDGEAPHQEVVRLERDVQCQSMQCIRQQGAAPYCTQSCTRHAPDPLALVCTRDSDCLSTTLQCHAGKCVSDDCPKDYWCRELQGMGIFADTSLCVQRTDCHSKTICTLQDTFSCLDLGCGVDCFATCPITQ